MDQAEAEAQKCKTYQQTDILGNSRNYIGKPDLEYEANTPKRCKYFLYFLFILKT